MLKDRVRHDLTTELQSRTGLYDRVFRHDPLFAKEVMASLVTQLVKNPPAMQETWVKFLRQEDPPGEGNGYPRQYSCLEKSMDREAWQALQSMES